MVWGIIYKITNLINGKIYIGQTVKSLEKRWKNHLASSKKSNYPIHLAIKKYGQENFSREILFECSTQEELNSQELKNALELNSFAPNGYNLAAGDGKGKWSEETKKKMSLAKKGKPMPEDQKIRLRTLSKGRKHSEETKKKMSLSRSGDKNPLFGKKGEKSPLFGKHRSKEVRQKISENHGKAKEYFLISPTGEHISGKNLRKFCRDNDINYNSIKDITYGKPETNTGWRRDKKFCS